MSSARFPARLHVLLAADAPVGLVIRRGPAKSVCAVRWDLATNEFTLGQWMRGRIYERRCDLSPDGKYWIYFAMNGRWHSGARGAWSAISRPPYLTAITLYPKGDCWVGGGLFTGKRTYWLNDGYGHEPPAVESREVIRDKHYIPAGGRGGECLSVYYPRLLRDGWIHRGRVTLARNDETDTFEKPIGAGWTLQKLAHTQIGAPQGKGCYWDEHRLVHESGKEIDGSTWEWAEFRKGDLFWAAEGKLYAGVLRKGVVIDQRMLFDFNPMTFQALAAPW